MIFIRADLYLLPLGNEEEVKALTQAQKEKIKTYMDSNNMTFQGLSKFKNGMSID